MKNKKRKTTKNRIAYILGSYLVIILGTVVLINFYGGKEFFSAKESGQANMVTSENRNSVVAENGDPKINLSFQNQTEIKTEIREETEAEKVAQFIANEPEELFFLEPTGSPNLPSKVFKLLLPPDVDLSSIEVDVKNIKTREIKDMEIIPTPPASTWVPVNKKGENIKADQVDEKSTWKQVTIWPKGENAYDKEGRDMEIYNKNILYPEKISEAKKFSLGKLRGYQIIEIPVNTFQYNPVKKTLIKIESFDLDVNFNFLDQRKRSPDSFQTDQLGTDRVKDLVSNFDQFSTSYQSRTRNRNVDKSSYIIITTEEIENNSTQLANFVTQKDKTFNTKVVTMKEIRVDLDQCNSVEDCEQLVGDPAAENIRAWLQANWENLNIEYVLLIGGHDSDVGDVPMKILWDEYRREVPSDFYYSDMDGNWDLNGNGKYGEWGFINKDFGYLDGEWGVDKQYDLIIGRIPYYGITDDLDKILIKTINYENSNDTAWRNNILTTIKRDDDYNELTGYLLGEVIKDDFDKYISKYHRIYDEDYKLNPPPETMPTDIDKVLPVWQNEKFGFVIFQGHGGSKRLISMMDIPNAKKLEDGYPKDYPAFTFQNSCYNGYLDSGEDNFSYALLRHAAINTISTTTAAVFFSQEGNYRNTSTSMGFAYRYSKNLLENKQSSGESLFNAKENISITNSNGKEYWINFIGFNIYGDPSLRLNSPEVPYISKIDNQYVDLESNEIEFDFEVENYESSSLTIASSNTDIVKKEDIILEQIEGDKIHAKIKVNKDTLTRESFITIKITNQNGVPKTRKFSVILEKAFYVSPSPHGDDSNNGDINSHFATIQHAINKAQARDKIIITSGTYKENIKIENKDNIYLFGENEVIIDGTLNSSTIYLEKSKNITIDNISIINGSRGGIFNNKSFLNIKNSSIYDNQSTGEGGGIYNDGILYLSNTEIYNNESVRGGAGIYNVSNMEMINCVVYSNRVTSFYDSIFTIGGGIYNDPSVKFYAENSIIYNNKAISGHNNINRGRIEYSNVQTDDNSVFSGKGNINQEPLFVNPENGDFHLKENSPCIDAGNPSSDYSKELGANGNRINMGVYGGTEEATISNEIRPIFLASQKYAFTNSVINFTNKTKFPNDANINYKWSFGDDSASDEENPTHVYANTGKYTVTLEVIWDDKRFFEEKIAYINIIEDTIYVSEEGDNNNIGTKSHPLSSIQEAIDIALDSCKIFISPGTYKENLVVKNKNIQLIGESEDVIIDGSFENTVLISNNSTLIIKNILFIKGEGYRDIGGILSHESNLDIIDSQIYDNKGVGIYSYKSTVNIKNSEVYENDQGIKNKKSLMNISSSEIYKNKKDGGINNEYLSTLNITSSNIYKNEAFSYAGIHSEYKSILNIEHSNIYRNKATKYDVGGIAVHVATIRNSNIYKNEAKYDTGGIKISAGRGSSLFIINSNIYGNKAGGKVGGIYREDQSSILHIVNSNIYGNTASDDSNVYFYDDSNLTISHSNIQDMEEDPSKGIISQPPLFANITGEDYANYDFSLQPTSPCIDAGTAELGVDLDGDGENDVLKPKIDYFGVAPDIGSAEYKELNLTYDINGDGVLEAFQDGILVQRYLFRLDGNSLMGDYRYYNNPSNWEEFEDFTMITESSTRKTAEEIVSYIKKLINQGLLDIDGNGEADALTDGVLLIRHMENYQGEELINNAIDVQNATRKTAKEIAEFIENTTFDPTIFFWEPFNNSFDLIKENFYFPSEAMIQKIQDTDNPQNYCLALEMGPIENYKSGFRLRINPDLTANLKNNKNYQLSFRFKLKDKTNDSFWIMSGYAAPAFVKKYHRHTSQFEKDQWNSFEINFTPSIGDQQKFLYIVWEGGNPNKNNGTILIDDILVREIE
jgi:hypothetical protein